MPENTLIRTEADIVVAYDTNFLIIPSKFKVDIFEKCKILFIGRRLKLITIDKVMDELTLIASRKTKDSTHAKVGLKLVEKKKIEIISTPKDKYADDALMKLPEMLDKSVKEFYIATMDLELRRRMKSAGIGVISLRKKSVLQIV